MDNWGGQMLEIAQSVATTDLRRAISIAKVIPERTSAAGAAQNAIQQWQQQLDQATPPATNENGLPN